MLRISVLNGSQSARLKLEGKLAHDEVAEAQKAWTALTDIAGKKKVVVDLADISFVDDPGKELLSLFHQCGSELVGSGPMIAALIDEIHKKTANTKSNFRKEIASLLLILLFLIVSGSTGRAQEATAAEALTIERVSVSMDRIGTCDGRKSMYTQSIDKPWVEA
jgi:anti-anti-sigma regulatory factor